MKGEAARESIEMGAMCAIVGLTVGVFLVGGDLHDRHNFFSLLWLFAPASALLVGMPVWYFTVSKKGDYDTGTGAVAGILISLVSQYLCLFLRQIYHLGCYYATRNYTNSFGEPPPGISELLFLSAGVTVLGLLWLGWITIPLGGVVGMVVVKIQRKRHDKPNQEDAPEQNPAR